MKYVHEIRTMWDVLIFDALDRQLAEIVENNREDEIRLRKEKGQAESALNGKIAQYDEDMGARLKTMDDLKSSYDIESKEYGVLKAYFDRIDTDVNRGAEEEKILAAVARR